MIIRSLTILFLVALILGGAAYFAYELYWKPARLDAKEKQELADVVPTPPPDLSAEPFATAKALFDAGKRDEARPALARFIETFPDSGFAPEARKLLGTMNAEALFSTDPGPDKSVYTVVRGDALVKIAAKTGTGAELIYRVNNLESINLQIGQELVVPKLDTSIVIDRATNTLTVLNNTAFFAEYPIVSLTIPKTLAETKVADKIALYDNKRVAFGDKNYAGSDRWLMLGQGVVIRSLPPPAEGAPPPSTPPGIIVSPEAMDEIFLLVSRGNPVTIR